MHEPFDGLPGPREPLAANRDTPAKALSEPHHPVPFHRGDALVIVDVQNDFLSGGALPVPHGDEVVPVLNHYLAHFAREKLPVFATREWHPDDHASFHNQGGPSPRHCIMHTVGAEFAANLKLPAGVVVVSKGRHPDDDGRSGFIGTDLEEKLRAAGVARLYIGGLATDTCVLATVRDALQRGFGVHLLRDAVRAVDQTPEAGSKAEAEVVQLGAVPFEMGDIPPSGENPSALLTDLYQLTMLRGYWAAGMDDIAVFEFFVRRLPPGWNFLVAAGLEQVLAFLEDFHFSAADLAWLERTGEFDPAVIRQLDELHFTGDVHAVPEGTIFFPDEPILRITAPLPQAQVIETRLVNLLHFQTLIASKAARCVLAAPGRQLVDCGLRRSHGAEAGLLAARACYLAGFAGSSDVLCRARFGIPCFGTMAHSFVEACASEEEAFLRFARANPAHVVLLIDTYDTEVAAFTVARIAPVLHAEGIRIRGVRLDSGDLAAHAWKVRRILDEGGLREVPILASGNLDERDLQRLVAAGAPIDGFDIGSQVITSADAPVLDCAYKLQEYGGTARCKHSEGKATWPGAKQVYRHFDRDGRMECDTIALASEVRVGEPLFDCVMRGGRRVAGPVPLPAVRERVGQQLASLPPGLRGLEAGEAYAVSRSSPLQELALQLGVLSCLGGGGPTTSPALPHHLGFLGRIHADGGPESEDLVEALSDHGHESTR